MGSALSDPIPHLSNSLFYLTFLGKESILITTALVICLLVAIALGSVRTVLVAIVLLLCVMFQALLALIVSQVSGGIYPDTHRVLPVDCLIIPKFANSARLNDTSFGSVTSGTRSSPRFVTYRCSGGLRNAH